MSLPARRELLASTAPRYAKTNKKQKQIILDEFTAATGYHRKYAISLLNKDPAIETSEMPPLARRPRKTRYGSEVRAALVTLWEAAGRICSKRLVPFLPQLVEVLERHGYLSLGEQTRQRLLSIALDQPGDGRPAPHPNPTGEQAARSDDDTAGFAPEASRSAADVLALG